MQNSVSTEMFTLDKNQAWSNLPICTHAYCISPTPSSLQTLTYILKPGRGREKKPSQINLESEMEENIG